MEPITIVANGQVLAHIFPGDLHAPKGVRFLNEPTEPLQIGLMERQPGHHVQAHMHPPCKRELDTSPEFFFVQHGRIRVTIYDDAWTKIASHELSEGDSMLLLHGGHEVEMLEPTRMFEIKQGPFMGDAQQKVFRTPS